MKQNDLSESTYNIKNLKRNIYVKKKKKLIVKLGKEGNFAH